MSLTLFRWLKERRRTRDRLRLHTAQDEDVLSANSREDPYQGVQLLTCNDENPPIRLDGNQYSMDAQKGSQKLPRYMKATAVSEHRKCKNLVSFRQDDREATCKVSEVLGKQLLTITAPQVTMQMVGVLLPNCTSVPKDADDWRIGILQVMKKGKASGHYRGTKGDDVCKEEHYFSPQLPLIDRITEKTKHQGPAGATDPAYSNYASSSANIKNVYNGKKVYCQLLMYDQPRETFSISACGNSGGYLNSVNIESTFMTMVCVYKPGLDTSQVFPLLAVEWHFNATATRNLTATNKFRYDVTPSSSKTSLITYSPEDNLKFNFKCLKKDHSKETFACPNTAQKLKYVPIKKLTLRETFV